MSEKIYVHPSYVPELAAMLRACGYEVNDRPKDWRVLMWRRDCREWSQAYTGLTAKAKRQRETLTVFGPEVAAINEVMNGE